MRKQVLWAFLCGLLLPLVLAAVGGREASPPTVPEGESEGITISLEDRLWDAQTRIMVLTPSGNVRQMRLSEYLAGVVLAEMPTDFEDEALKAQAVVARTYTCKRMEHYKHGAAAVCMDSGCCQGFWDEEDYVNSGGSQEALDRIRSAVTSTDGLVLYYGGELIDATYFSCSGGFTEDAAAVWGQDVPYLQSVESPGEENAPRYVSTVRYTPENFCLVTGCGGEGNPSGWFGQVRYTDGGGVESMKICGKTYTGTQLRSALNLRSTLFSIRVESGMIVIETKGFGHRVGMSQYGAQAMALEGSAFEQILKHYYTGTVLRNQGGA
ncbi:MAG: stage II sporulation protein D [Oscillospiraceae bacterium]|nr:stage II sporulation protein D [Oscillospiraceae bacterium]